MLNLRMVSTFAGAGMALSVLIGFGIARAISRRRAPISETPPYVALRV